MPPSLTEAGYSLILASTSPRRREILARLHIPFRVIPPRFEEISKPALSAKAEALYFAEGKARSVARDFQEAPAQNTHAIVIGSDTLIECDQQKVGKPKDAKDAKRILQGLQGRSHCIWTAVSMIDTRLMQSEHIISRVDVSMKSMTKAEISDYVATGEPLDKAGAYAVQGEGRRFIQTLKGDYLAAVGLPLDAIARFLQRMASVLIF